MWIDKLARFIVDNTKKLIASACVLFVLNVLLIACHSATGITMGSLVAGLRIASSFLMTLESPTQLASLVPAEGSILVELSSWSVCLSGWLMIPLLIGSLVARASEIKDQEIELQIIIVQLGQKRGLTGAALNEFVKNKMEIVRTSILGRRS